MFSFIETKLFTRLVQEYLSDDEYAQLQQALIANPEAGSVISGSGGVRKLRWGVAGRIVWAWVLTIPVAATVSALCFWAIHFIFPAA